MLGNFEYKRIRSIEEGCLCLAEAAGEGAVLAGGTDLLVEIRNGLKSPHILVDCRDMDVLKTFHIDSSGSTIGASVPLNRLIENRGFHTTYPALADALLSIGTYQLRNRATLAGNICNASPAADSAPVLLVLGAVVDVIGVEGARTIPLSDFFAGVKRTTLKSDEIVTGIRLPDRSDVRTGFKKQQRIRGHDLAVVNVAIAYSQSEKTVRLAIGSCAPTPVLLDPIAVDSNKKDAFVGHVIDIVRSSISPISDVRASADYRNAVLPILIERILNDLLPEGGRS
ncbi:FAD binding domain-containing protein [Candidatus Bipolaricaulota bacterium]|nr:FAD binding domain-containing protein [Candidatus Bipolaricaulota bacterium]